ncbi:MAG TPA: alpha-amylase family glycosyl hydrolase [Acidobacteriota bacterium]|jgi:glycosidase
MNKPDRSEDVKLIGRLPDSFFAISLPVRRVVLLAAVTVAGVFAMAGLGNACGRAGAGPPAPVVTKVEPPSWWAAHTINPVRLLVRGANLAGARVTATRPETVPTATRANGSGTYLFVDVKIDPGARAGQYSLVVQTDSGRAIIPFHLETRLDPAHNFQGISGDDAIYLIMPDRFANGDPSNDLPSGAPGASTDRQNPRAYHGGDLRGVIEKLPYLKQLGVTALWLNPWYDNWNGLRECDKPWCPTTHYHGYHAIDYYGVEDRFGALSTLQELTAKAHALGLKVIQDQVANHVGWYHPWVKDPPQDNWFHPMQVSRPFRADLLLSPHASRSARQSMLDSWFTEDLPDLNQDEPEVARYEIQNALWWVGITGLDGIRQDTAQYMPRTFIHALAAALHREYPRLWMVGEVFNRDPAHTAFFMGGRKGWDGVDTGLDSVFDFPLWQTSIDVFTNKKPVHALRDVLKYDAIYPDSSRLTTMTGNHDVRRFLSLEGGTLEGAMLHTAFILTVRGTPQLYYGDEIAMGGGNDPDNRRDFPGGFPGDKRNAFQQQERSSEEQRMYQWTHDWLYLRREHPAIRRGVLMDLAFDEETYAYARRSADETVVIAINRAGAPRKISASAGALGVPDGTQFTPLLAAQDAGNVTAGVVTLTLPAKAMVAYRVNRQ